MLFVGAGVSAQNLQFHYDFGRNLYDDLDKTADSDGRAPITTTVEMFRADSFGSTFFFIDLDYNSGVKGAYWEISRELCFWKNSKMNWLSAHLEYDGGLSKAAGSYNNAWLIGPTYSGHSKDFSKTWSLTFMYKYIPNTVDTSHIFLSEPQFWVNLRNIKGWDNVRLSVGGEVEISNNFVAKGFYAIPTLGAKWTF